MFVDFITVLDCGKTGISEPPSLSKGDNNATGAHFGSLSFFPYYNCLFTIVCLCKKVLLTLL